MTQPGISKLGSEVKRRRLQKGMTQKQLASKADCDHSYISMIESGNLDPRVGPSESLIHRLAKETTLGDESSDVLFDFFWTECLGRLSKTAQRETVEAKRSADGWIIGESAESFETWISKEFVSDDLRKQLRKADILVVPTEGFRDQNVPVFPENTVELFNFIKSNLKKDLSIDICIEDNDYKELALYHDLVIIASFVATSIAIPFLINILSDYVSQKKLKFRDRKVRIFISCVSNTGEPKDLFYEGPVEGIAEILERFDNL